MSAHSNNNSKPIPAKLVLPYHIHQFIAAAHTLVCIKFNIRGKSSNIDYSQLPIDPRNYIIHNSNINNSRILDPDIDRKELIDRFNQYCQIDNVV